MRVCLASLLCCLLVSPLFAEDERLAVRPSAEVEAGLYGETGRLTIRLTFRAEEPPSANYRVVLHLADPESGISRAEADHVPPISTERWGPGEPVRYTVTAVVPERDGKRPAVVVLVGLADPTLDNGYRGRLRLDGDDLFLDRRYVVARVEAASGAATSAELRRVAAERAQRGETSEAFHLLEQAMARGETLEEKLAVTADLLALPPPPGDPVSGPEEVRVRQLVAAEKLRWLRDRASELLRQKELRLALRVMEKVGGVADEERNTKVVGEPNAASRAQKDIVDVKSRLLQDLSQEEKKEAERLLEKAEDDPKKIFKAGEAEAKKGRLVIARRLMVEVLYHQKADAKLKDRVRKAIADLEQRILYDLTPEEEKRLEKVSDHPAFHRLASVPTGRFVFLGPEGLVSSIPRESSHRLDVASVLLTDLWGRSPVDPGQRVIVFYKETYSGPATGGGGQIIIGDADPNVRNTRVDTGLYYHEFTHCVDDIRPVHDYKRGLTEGLANLGSVFVQDMFAGEQGRFEAFSQGGRAAFRRHHLDRENAYWLIPAYGPSEGFLEEILARHAPAANGHVDWPRFGQALRDYRASQVRSPRTHRIMAHMGEALAREMGSEVWDTLREFRFPVGRETGDEIADLRLKNEFGLRSLFMRRNVAGLLAFADRVDPEFVASRARYGALEVLDGSGKGESEEAERIRQRLGVIRKLHVVGPFYPAHGSGLAEIFPPGEELDLTKTYMTPQGEARWRVPEKNGQLARLDARGVVLLRYGYPDLAVTYALTHVTVPEALDAIAWIGADDEVALWVNGVHVQRNHGRRPLVPDWERWPCRLAGGRNRILLKVANQDGQTGFSIRLTKTDGSPIEGMMADLDPPTPDPEIQEPKWISLLRDDFHRRSLGRKYEVAAGAFKLERKLLFGEATNRRPGWRPFSVRPGFPQDTPAALLWVMPGKDATPADFLLRLTLPEPVVPKIVITWDGEGDELPLSGWSLILVPKGENFTARIERYDYLHYLKGMKAPDPKTWKKPVVEVKRIGHRIWLTLGETVVLDGISAPPLRKRRIGLAVWGPEPKIDALEIFHPREEK